MLRLIVTDRSRSKQERGQSTRKIPVRRQIERESLPLPPEWSNFMALEDNKADLALLLSNDLIDHSPSDQTMVVAGGFSEATIVKSSIPTLDLSTLEADHEEADARLIVHCIHAHMESMVVYVRNIDVLVLLLAHYDKMRCTNLLMKAGTSKHLCLDASPRALSSSSHCNLYGLGSQGWTVSTATSLSITHSKSMLRDHVMWVYHGMPE